MNIFDVILGGLLHDIGKLSHRADGRGVRLGDSSIGLESTLCPVNQGRYTHRHVLYTHDFADQLTCLPFGLNQADVCNLASYHHRPSTPEQEIIAKADRISAGMERESESGGGNWHAFRRVRLQSVAAELGDNGVKAFYGLAPMEPQQAFPCTNQKEEDLSQEWARLFEQFSMAWKENQCSDPIGFINRAESILEKFTWCVPSAANALPDISLFDHLKTTAAISGCLFAAGQETEKPFLLVTGEISGIQKYIFGIRQGTGGLARRLRARSMGVSIYAEMVALEILRKLNLPLTQRLLFAGGKFHLLLPNTQASRDVLNQCAKTSAQWLFERSGGEMGLVLANYECDTQGLKSFTATLTDLNQRLREAKDRGQEHLLQSGARWSESTFVLSSMVADGDDGVCECCRAQGGRFTLVRNKEAVVCSICEADDRRGRKLVKARYLAYLADGMEGEKGPGGSFALWPEIPRDHGRPSLIVDLDGGYPGRGDPFDLPLVRRPWARYVPRDPNGDVLPFDELVKKSVGTDHMAYLKMDVDDLGWVFSQGLKGAKEDHTSISRVATLSRALELFFSGWLERALREEFQDVYLVYSGGDDVLAIGPWNVMFNLAGRIRSEFRRFTADNPLWTLSAGLALARVHTPVLTAVEEAEKNLEASKDIKGSGVLPWPLSPKVQTGQREKDRITAWNTSIPWARYEDTLGQAKKLLKWLEDQVLTTGQVRRLRAYAEMWREYVWKRDTRYLQYAPLLVRDLKRTWKEDTAEQREAKQWAAGLAAWPVTRELDGLFFVSQYALNGVRAKAEKEETGGAA